MLLPTDEVLVPRPPVNAVPICLPKSDTASFAVNMVSDMRLSDSL